MSDNEVSAEGNPPISNGTIPENAEHSSWQFLRRIVKRHPLMTLIVGLFSGTAIATLLGFPVHFAREFLLFATVIISIAGLVFAYWGPKPTKPALPNSNQDESGSKATAPRKGFWPSWWQIIIILTIGKIIQPWIKEEKPQPFKPHFPPRANSRPHNQANHLLRDPSQTDFLFSLRARNSANYWKVTVADLHTFRFADPPANSEESATAYYQRFLERIERAIQTAQSVSPANVDPDLVVMSQAHLQSNTQLLKMVRELEQMSMEPGHIPSKTTLREMRSQEDQKWDILMNMTEEEFAALPEQQQQIVISLFQSLETREQQLREIETMQARLSERYPGQSFSLPNVLPEDE